MAQPVPKTSYTHIALLTDLTSKSHAALSYARAFAHHYSSRLTLVHVLPDPSFPKSRLSRAYERHLGQARAELHALAAALRSDGIDAQVHLSETASCTHGLVEAIRHHRPELVIQGTAGVDDARRAVIGSVAESIFRKVDIPVLTVGSRLPAFMGKELQFERVLMMTDFGKQSAEIAIYALSLAQEFRSRISLCHIHEGRFAPWQKQEVQHYFDRALSAYITPPVRDWCDPESVVAFGEVDTEIDSLLQQKKPDLILMGAHSLGPLGTRGKPGIAFRLIAKAQCPVLTLLDSPQGLPAETAWKDAHDLAIFD